MTTIVYHTELRNPKREAMLTSNGKASERPIRPDIRGRVYGFRELRDAHCASSRELPQATDTSRP